MDIELRPDEQEVEWDDSEDEDEDDLEESDTADDDDVLELPRRSLRSRTLLEPPAVMLSAAKHLNHK